MLHSLLRAYDGPTVPRPMHVAWFVRPGEFHGHRRGIFLWSSEQPLRAAHDPADRFEHEHLGFLFAAHEGLAAALGLLKRFVTLRFWLSSRRQCREKFRCLPSCCARAFGGKPEWRVLGRTE